MNRFSAVAMAVVSVGLMGCPKDPVAVGSCSDSMKCATGVCLDGTCVECATKADCTGGKICSSTHTCTGCASTAECGANFICNPTTQRCEVKPTGCDNGANACPTGQVCVDAACVECGAATDCDAGLVCNAMHACVGCTMNSECAPGETCNSTTHLCTNMCDVAQCPVPAHAAARCLADGGCGRGPCDPGFFDFDQPPFGCETSCTGNVCTLGDGGSITLTAPPIQERGAWNAPVSGGSHGDKVQTSSQFTNVGQLGEPTPGGSVEQSSAQYKNVGGFNAILRKP